MTAGASAASPLLARPSSLEHEGGALTLRAALPHNGAVPRRTVKPVDSALQSAVGPRNFTVELDERVRGLAGPPAYAVRKRRIEDLEEELVAAVRLITPPDDGSGLTWEDLLTTLMKKRFVTLNELIVSHNRYYPIEANLPLDVTTGRTIDRSGSWPHPPATWAALVARAREEQADADDRDDRDGRDGRDDRDGRDVR